MKFVILAMLICVNACRDNKSKISPADINYLQPVVLLCLHDIGGAGKYSIKLKEFEKIIKYLSRMKYQVLSLSGWFEKKDRMADRTVVLTFDDGFPSLFKKVIPLLNKFGFSATFFIYLDRHRDKSPFYKKLRNLPDRFEIGSHSFRHLNMKLLVEADIENFYKEVFLSKKKLEYLTGRNISTFAWPYGRYNAKMVKLARKAGYRLQVSTDYRFGNRKKAEYILPRFTLQQPGPLSQVKGIIKRHLIELKNKLKK